MLFNSIQFAIFFLFVLAGYRSLPVRHRSSWLLVSSLIFYFLWIPVYLFLLLGDLSLNYWLLRRQVASAHPRRYLIASLAVSLGILGYFKYAAFFIDSLRPAAESAGLHTFSAPDILLPLGISFFTFQLLALSIDVYRSRESVPSSFREYLLFLSFFPQLIAGPILRGREFLPQLRAGGKTNAERDRRGLWLIASGLAKKVILADFLLAPFANQIFGAPGDESGAYHLVALYSFSFQIYCDFSGYSDMARGLALLLGFELPLNFREPYLSRSPSEFWRRWHITLSSWLRDYLYIPLGGNRGSPGALYRNLWITMLLGGLWHGAGWNFVIWGGLHGLILVIYRRLGADRDTDDEAIRVRDLPAIVLNFHLTCLIWIFFRAANFEDAMAYLSGLFRYVDYVRWPSVQVAVILLCVGLHLLERVVRTRLPEIRSSLLRPGGAWVEGAVFGAILALCLVLGGSGGEFIYFQF